MLCPNVQTQRLLSCNRALQTSKLEATNSKDKVDAKQWNSTPRNNKIDGWGQPTKNIKCTDRLLSIW
jgi:hypothetical protein